MSESTIRTRKLTLMAMLSAMAYVLMLVGRIPVVMFLSYDPKDIILAIGGFMLGPGAVAIMSLLVSLVEMLTASDTGLIGFFMNVISTCAFLCPAAWIYQRRRTLRGAAIGLCIGVALMTLFMLAWNYIITPLYLNYPREDVAALLVPVFLPFNLLKGGLNAGITLLIYKPVSSALRRAGLAPVNEAHGQSPRKFSLPVTIAAAAVVITCALLFYLMAH